MFFVFTLNYEYYDEIENILYYNNYFIICLTR